MLLAIDIGNTNISFGVFRKSRLIKRFNIPTKSYSFHKLKRLLRSPMENKGSLAMTKRAVIARSPEGDSFACHCEACEAGRSNLKTGSEQAAQSQDRLAMTLCSVVPSVTKIIAKDLKSLLKKKPYIIGKDIEAPIKNLYRRPKQVGQDRLVNAYAGVALYGAPLVVVDFGTAITFDVISRKKEYLGGMILPGLQISLDALSSRTALLPKIKLSRPQEFIARDTENSMLSGIIYGFAALADNLAVKIRKVIGKDALIIGTGGNIDLMAKYCKNFDSINEDLTLIGLNLILQKKA